MSVPSIAAKYGLSQAEIDAIKGSVAYYPVTGGPTEERPADKDAKDNDWLVAHQIPGISLNKETLGEGRDLATRVKANELCSAQTFFSRPTCTVLTPPK